MPDKPHFTEGKPSGFRQLLGYRIVVWRAGHAELVMDLEAKHMNGLGIVHGGVYATLLDAAQGHAVTFCPVPENTRTCVTISLTTSFLSAARDGQVRAIGRLIGIHDRVATAHAEMYGADGTLLAAAQASFRYMPGSERLEGVPRQGPHVR
ncbi:MAG: PaaI family thioesterase [Hyphomicrobiaceae bacterium]|jgi:uncharacterized protein (TIGR00369 family)